MHTVGHYWAAAAFSGFAAPSDWRSWADAKILESDGPEDWIIGLSLATSESDLVEPLRQRMSAEDRECGRRTYIGNAKLGFIYWSFKLERMSIEAFLQKAGDEADGGTGDLECEKVYAILNRLEARQTSGATWEDLLEEADELFFSYWEIAKKQWAALGMSEPSAE